MVVYNVINYVNQESTVHNNMLKFTYIILKPRKSISKIINLGGVLDEVGTLHVNCHSYIMIFVQSD